MSPLAGLIHDEELHPAHLTVYILNCFHNMHAACITGLVYRTVRVLSTSEAVVCVKKLRDENITSLHSISSPRSFNYCSRHKKKTQKIKKTAGQLFFNMVGTSLINCVCICLCV